MKEREREREREGERERKRKRVCVSVCVSVYERVHAYMEEVLSKKTEEENECEHYLKKAEYLSHHGL